MARTRLALIAATTLTLGLIGDAAARNLSYSAGQGVKCDYVLVSSERHQHLPDGVPQGRLKRVARVGAASCGAP